MLELINEQFAKTVNVGSNMSQASRHERICACTYSGVSFAPVLIMHLVEKKENARHATRMTLKTGTDPGICESMFQ